MKKQGFTLAEVLVTLGIIGVVAALTTPALIQNVGNAKVGPKLQKAVATFETASEMMLTELNSNSMLGISTDVPNLGKEMMRFMKITPVSGNTDIINYKGYGSNNTLFSSNSTNQMGNRYDSEEGLIYYIRYDLAGAKDSVNAEYADIPNNQRIGEVFVDINGPDGPNTVAKDLFKFALFNDGTLRPWGGKGFLRHKNAASLATDLWSNHTCTKTHVKNHGFTCTGSIFDNGMKIIYQ